MDMKDKFTLDYTKMDLLASKIDLIFKIFKIIVEFGDIVKANANTLTKDMKVWVILLGEKVDRNNAKKYVNSLCNPEFTQKLKINEKLLNLVQSNNYITNLIRDYKVHVELISNTELIIQGDLDQASQVKCIIDLENNRLKDTVKFTAGAEKMDDEDVICINDPYEIFSTNTKKSKNNSKKSESSKNFNDILMGVHKDDLMEIEPKKTDSKKSTLNSINGDCEIVNFVPSMNVIKKASSGTSQVLNEYAEMFSQEYDKDTEKMNKVKRIDKLISAMPDEQKILALNQVNSYQKKKPIIKGGNMVDSDENEKSSKEQVPIFNSKIHVAKSQQNLAQSNLDYIFNNLVQKDNSDEINFKPNVNKSRSRNRSRKNNLSVERNSSDSNFQMNTNVKNPQRSWSNYPATKVDSSKLRFIIIDGSNVAREHGKEYGKCFSCKGIKLVVDFFLNRGHKEIKALVPRFRRGTSDKDCPTRDPEILDFLEENGYLTYTPSRKIDNKLIVSYDDRFILNAAQHYNAVIVSNDQYRDLMDEKLEWKTLIHNNLLQYSFIGDLFMIADDPMGRKGPNIEQFLSVGTGGNFSNKKNFNPIVNTTSKNDSKSIPSLMSTLTDNSNNFLNFKKKEVQNEKNNLAKPSGNERSSQETEQLITVLKEMFPDNENKIKSLVHGNRNVKNIDYFLNRLLK